MQLSYLLLAMAIFAGTPAMAQKTVTLEVIVGTVLVDAEVGLVQAFSTTTLNPGDRVFLKSGSAAVLSNVENGCFISLRAAGEYIIPLMEDCTTGQASVMSSNIEVIPANGTFNSALVGGPTEAGIEPLIMATGFVAIVAGSALYSTVFSEDAAVSTP